jgi:hypothetical protein
MKALFLFDKIVQDIYLVSLSLPQDRKLHTSCCYNLAVFNSLLLADRAL